MVCFPRCLFGPAMFGLMWLCSYGEPSQVTLRFSEIITILYAQLHVMCLKPRYTEDWFIETPQSKNWLKSLLKRKAHCKTDFTLNRFTELGFYHHYLQKQTAVYISWSSERRDSNWWCHQVTYDCDLKQNVCTTVRSTLFWMMNELAFDHFDSVHHRRGF